MSGLADWGYLDAIGCIVAGICSMLAVTVGLGGGAFYVTIAMLLMGMTPHLSTALSQCLMAGAALSNFIIVIRSRHPSGRRPLLTLDLVLLIAPFLLSGTAAGVIINRLSHPYFIVAIVLVVMLIADYRTWMKATLLFRQEKMAKAQHSEAAEEKPGVAVNLSETKAIAVDVEIPEGASPTSLSKEDGKVVKTVEDETEKKEEDETEKKEEDETEKKEEDKAKEETTDGDEEDDADVDSEKSKVEKVSCDVAAVAVEEQTIKIKTGDDGGKDVNQTVMGMKNPFAAIFEKTTNEQFVEARRNFSAKKWVALAGLWLLNFFFSFIRGSGEGSLNLVVACTWEYWLILGMNIVALAVFGVTWYFYIRAETDRKIALGYEFIDGEFPFNLRLALLCGIGSFIAGAYGGLAGVGGSVILTPILLYLNIIPQVIVGISSTVVFLASSAASAIYLSTGTVDLDVAAVMALTCFVFTMVGKIYLDKWVKAHNAPSTILFIFLAIMTLSMCTLAGTTLYKTLIGEADTGGVAFLCGTTPEAEVVS